jgi:hypothetical protein
VAELLEDDEPLDAAALLVAEPLLDGEKPLDEPLLDAATLLVAPEAAVVEPGRPVVLPELLDEDLAP